MKNLAKLGLIAALCGMFLACGSDSGTSSNGENNDVIPDSDRGSSIKYGSMTDSRDGQTYKTVTIGEQTWMAENLNYAYNEPTLYLYSSSFCYNNSADSCSKYGRLYLWSAAMDSAAVFSDDGKGCGYYGNCSANGNVRGVCPEGWHLPSKVEWSTLFDEVGGTSTSGTMLKSTSGWDGGNGDDSYGFTVLPAGSRYYDGDFDGAGTGAHFWSSTEGNSYYAYGWYFYYGNAYVDEYDSKIDAFSVRCVRNSNDEGSEASSSSSQAQPSSSSSSVIPDSNRYSSSSSSSWSVAIGSMTDARDGQTYKTVTIGEQTWMAENLNYAYNEPTIELDSSSFCYNNELDSCATYGRLYLWSAAMDSAAVFSDDGKGCGYGATCGVSGNVRGVCPEGWHLPDTTELSTLFRAVGGTSSAGTMFMSTSGWHNVGNGEDSYGFSVLPAGYRYGYGYFNYAGYYADFWSSTEYDSYDAYDWDFRYSRAYVLEYYLNKDYAFSVRCVRN